MEYTRLLKRFKSGNDVKYVKDHLVELGYLEKSTTKIFGNDTYNAVKSFQSANNLEVDGIVGPATWAMLFSENKAEAENAETNQTQTSQIPSHITTKKAKLIANDLSLVSEKRKSVVLSVLQYTTDPDIHDKIRCFYIRGGNLYDKDLSLYKMSAGRLESYFSKTSYREYYDGGRQEMIETQAKASKYQIPGADCSGTVVGIWRHLKFVNSGFDASANSLYNTYCTDVAKPRPGDLAWRNGHIGIYVGGGYIAENIGGAYGLQLTKVNSRKAYNFVDGKIHSFSSWSAFGDPRYY